MKLPRFEKVISKETWWPVLTTFGCNSCHHTFVWPNLISFVELSFSVTAWMICISSQHLNKIWVRTSTRPLQNLYFFSYSGEDLPVSFWSFLELNLFLITKTHLNWGEWSLQFFRWGSEQLCELLKEQFEWLTSPGKVHNFSLCFPFVDDWLSLWITWFTKP